MSINRQPKGGTTIQWNKKEQDVNMCSNTDELRKHYAKEARLERLHTV